MTSTVDTPGPGSVGDFAWLVALARRLANPAEDPDDLAQQTWLVALEQPDRSKTQSRAWLAGVLRNLRRMRLRGDRRRRAREAVVEAAPELAADEAMARVEILEALRVALGELDPEDRRIVLARHATGTPAVEIAAQLGIPASTVRTRLQRARERLREQVERSRGVGCFAVFTVGDGPALAEVVAMSTTTKLTIGAAAVVLAALAIQRSVAAPAEHEGAREPAAQAATAPRPAGREVDASRAQVLADKRTRVREGRRRRLERAPTPIAAAAEDPPEVEVRERCDEGCLGTLSMQVALASAVAGCRDEARERSGEDPRQGRAKFRARVLAEPGIGAVIDGVELVDDTTGDDEFIQCVIESAPLAELRDPEHPIADAFVFRHSLGAPQNPAREFLADHRELLAAHPEFARLLDPPPGESPGDDDATAFARWVDGDPAAQAAFGTWAREQGIDLAHVRVE